MRLWTRVLFTFLCLASVGSSLQAAAELRAVWVTRDLFEGKTKADLAAAMQTLAENNFNVVYINVWSRGYPLWKSAIFARHTGISIDPDPQLSGRDVLAETIAEAHRVGLQVEAWFEYGFVGGWTGHPFPGIARKGIIFDAHPEWLAKSKSGADVTSNIGSFYWMAHTRPDTQKFLIDLALEVATQYDVDGIQFDRVSYPALDCGYDAHTTDLYKREHSGAAPPVNETDSAWMRWRADKLNAFVAALYEQIKARRPELAVSNTPAAFPQSYSSFLQDTPAWVNNAWVDASATQVYRSTASSYLAELDVQIASLSEDGRRRLFPAIATTNNGQPVGASEIIEMVRGTRARNLSGAALWYYTALLGVIVELRQQVFSESATVPYHNASWDRAVISIEENSADIQRSVLWENRSSVRGNYLFAPAGPPQTIEYYATVAQTDWYEVYAYVATSATYGTGIQYVIPFKSTVPGGVDVNQQLPQNAGWVKVGDVFLEANKQRQVLGINTRGQAAATDTVMLVRTNRRADTSAVPFRVPAGGGLTIPAAALSSALGTGHAVLDTTAGPLPAALSIFSFRSQGVLVSEAGVPGMVGTTRANLFVRRSASGDVRTAAALSNSSDTAAEVRLALVSETGITLGTQTVPLPARSQTSFFIDEVFPITGDFVGNLFLESGTVLPFGVVALATLTNTRGEFLITALPVFVPSAPAPARHLAHFADGGGYVTELVLQNNSGTQLAGIIEVRDTQGAPLALTIDGVTASSFSYSLGASATRILRTSGTAATVRTGSLSVQGGALTPDVALLFSYSKGGILVTQAGVPPSPASLRFRGYYTRRSGIPEKRTGVAIVNLNATPVSVRVRVKADDAQQIIAETTLTIPPRGQTARFLDEILTGVPIDFTGVYDVESDQPIAVTSLRGIVNERTEFLLSPLPLIDLTQPVTGTRLLVPHLAVGGGYTTEVLLLSTGTTLATGQVVFRKPVGELLPVVVY